MNSPASCATSCAMPTADEPNHSAANIRYIHNAVSRSSYMLYCTVRFSPSPKFATSRWDLHPTVKKVIHQLARPTTPNHIIGLHMLNFYCYSLCKRESKVLPEPYGPLGGADLRSIGPQPDTAAYTAKIADTGPVHRVVCPFTPRRLGRYQIILLGDRGTWV